MRDLILNIEIETKIVDKKDRICISISTYYDLYGRDLTLDNFITEYMEEYMEEYMKDTFCSCSFNESHNHCDCDCGDWEYEYEIIDMSSEFGREI